MLLFGNSTFLILYTIDILLLASFPFDVSSTLLPPLEYTLAFWALYGLGVGCSLFHPLLLVEAAGNVSCQLVFLVLSAVGAPHGMERVVVQSYRPSCGLDHFELGRVLLIINLNILKLPSIQ